MMKTFLDFNPDSERIRIARKRLAAAYARQPGTEAPIVDPGGVRSPAPLAERFADNEKMLAYCVELANSLAATDNDWPPFLDAFCTVPMAPEAFGSELHFRDNDIGVRPIIQDIHQVWVLKPKKMTETSTIRRMFDWVDFVQRKLGADVPIWVADIQSPFSVAAQIVSPVELLESCVTHPKAVHHLCRMVTEFTVELMRKHLAQIENPCFPGRNFPSIPENIGVCISDDTPLVMLGPEMYREFAFPYNAEISKVFGGIHIHSCGDYRHNLDNLLALPNIRSIQLHAGPGEFSLPTEASEDAAFNRARKQIAYFVDSNDVTRGDEYRNLPRKHYAEYVLPRLKQGDLTGCILQSCGVSPDEPDANTAIRWTRQQLSLA
ncbi:MAG: uroporphyrinogen decarboxylase family protein [Kiritimatiellae bacterium]|nr:uroporphyrinogen decarboxylase family protein [Kiritimatiellia bacterium]